MEADTEVTIIPKLRRVYKDTKANLDALTGLKDEDLGYATDDAILYRQNGAGAANWEALTANAAALVTTHAALPNVHHAPSWSLAERLTVTNTNSINSSVLTARDLWLIIIDIYPLIGSGAERAVNLMFNDDSGANYAHRIVDNTSIVVATGQTLIKVGSVQSYAGVEADFSFIAQLLIRGKTPISHNASRLAITGMAAGASNVSFNRLLNADWKCGTASITKFNFTFGTTFSGRIGIFYQDY